MNDLTGCSVTCCTTILAMGISIGAAAIVGSSIMPSIGVIGGIALIGIKMCISIPMYCCCFGSLNAITKKALSSSKCSSIILSLGLSIVGLLASQAICSTISGIPSFDFLEALTFYGYCFGIEAAIHLGFGSFFLSSVAAADHGGIGPGNLRAVNAFNAKLPNLPIKE